MGIYVWDGTFKVHLYCEDCINVMSLQMLYLLVPSLPPLLCRHGRSCAHRVWVEVVMKLLA